MFRSIQIIIKDDVCANICPMMVFFMYYMNWTVTQGCSLKIHKFTVRNSEILVATANRMPTWPRDLSASVLKRV